MTSRIYFRVSLSFASYFSLIFGINYLPYFEETIDSTFQLYILVISAHFNYIYIVNVVLAFSPSTILHLFQRYIRRLFWILSLSRGIWINIYFYTSRYTCSFCVVLISFSFLFLFLLVSNLFSSFVKHVVSTGVLLSNASFLCDSTRSIFSGECCSAYISL